MQIKSVLRFSATNLGELLNDFCLLYLKSLSVEPEIEKKDPQLSLFCLRELDTKFPNAVLSWNECLKCSIFYKTFVVFLPNFALIGTGCSEGSHQSDGSSDTAVCKISRGI